MPGILNQKLMLSQQWLVNLVGENVSLISKLQLVSVIPGLNTS